MNRIDFTYQDFIDHIENDIPFSFTRWGDGEANAILGTKKPHKAQHNCDHHQYFPDMKEAMIKVLKSEPDYYLGIQNLAMKLRGPEIEELIKGLNISFSDADILHKASIHGNLGKLFEALNEKKDKIVIIGPDYLKALKSKIDYRYFISISSVDCWLDKSTVINECARLCMNETGLIFLFSASMATNVWVDILYNRYGEDNSFLDMGSLWEPYIGRSNRSYHKDIIKREKRNLQVE